ncbi:MAG: hypothetical protein ACTSQG_08650 [Promethearchaeota archaeon]
MTKKIYTFFLIYITAITFCFSILAFVNNLDLLIIYLIVVTVISLIAIFIFYYYRDKKEFEYEEDINSKQGFYLFLTSFLVLIIYILIYMFFNQYRNNLFLILLIGCSIIFMLIGLFCFFKKRD